jgi:O-antigen/teichoic acid export membrane protein
MRALRHMGVVAAGTVVGQVCLMASTPVLTRLYDPVQIGYLTLFASYIGLLATTVSLHFELAIPLPASRRQAATLAALAVAVALAQSALVAAALPLLGPWLFGAEWHTQIGWAAYWWPLTLALIGVSGVLMHLAVRAQRFGAIGASRGLQGAVQAAGQVGSGIAGLPWTWLLAAQAAGIAAGMAPLARSGGVPGGPAAPRLRRLAAAARRHAAFPLASTPSSLLNAVANNLPPILLAWRHGPAAAAMYGVAMRILLVPARFLGQAVSQVVLGHAPDAARTGVLAREVTAMARLLCMLSVHIFVPTALFAGPLFRVAFGADWADSAVYAQCLAPWLLTSFVATPLSMLVTVLGQQRRELCFQAVLVATLLVALLAGSLSAEPVVAVAVLGVLAGIVQGVKARWLLGIAGCDAAAVLRTAGREVLLVAAAYLPLLAITSTWSDLAVIALAAPWALAFEWYSLRVRRLYG